MAASENPEFNRITEGLPDPDPVLEAAQMAAQQVGCFFATLKAFNIPDAQAEYLAKSWMELSSVED